MRKKAALFLLCFIIAGIIISALLLKKKPENEGPDFYTLILENDPELRHMEPVKAEFYATFSNISGISSFSDIQKYIFNIDPAAYVTQSDLPVMELSGIDLKTELKGNEPKILIFHTHASEDFSDSGPGEPEDTIVGVGRALASILAEDYGLTVVHDTGAYDVKDGKLVRGSSYENMEPAVSKILEKYPSVEITIDLHRDGVSDNMRLVTEIDGRPTARLMFFNGITRYNRGGMPVEMPSLENPYLKDNLALSLQMFLTSNEKYPGLARNIYIKPYRYSLHFKPKSMLVEVGANTSTVLEAKNAMYPLAEILVEVLGR